MQLIVFQNSYTSMDIGNIFRIYPSKQHMDTNMVEGDFIFQSKTDLFLLFRSVIWIGTNHRNMYLINAIPNTLEMKNNKVKWQRIK